MSAIEDARTLGRARLTFADEAEIDEFVETLGRFERGEIAPDAWRAYRLVRGTYGQRQSGDAQMLRVKIPEGILTVPQLQALADVAERYSRGFGHVTTRQNVQFHFIRLHEIEPAMRRLAEAGLTTREACGNSVRNIVACPFAGVAPDELFDVTPYAEALTRYLLRHRLSSSLPRKFKIGFEGCLDDHVMTPIHDIGWRATTRADGGILRRGFRVTVGGGTSILCSSGWLLYDFLPAGDLFNVAEAVIRVFARHGDYAHKHRNRMKFLIKALGWDGWRAAFDGELAGVLAEGGVPLPFSAEEPPVELPPSWARPRVPTLREVAALVSARPRGPGLVPDVVPSMVLAEARERWLATNVRRQRQAGFRLVTVTLPLGDLTGGQMRVIASLALAFGDGTVRTSPDQDLSFRWVREDDVSALYACLCAAGLARDGAGTIADVTSCPGAESCRLAVTQSRGLGRTLADHLQEFPELQARAGGLNIKISGCPNGCGQHHVSGFGFQGSVRKVGGRAIPQYFLLAGGGVDDSGAKFGRVVAKIPARRCAEAVDRLIALYATERRPDETAPQFFGRLDLERFKSLLGDLERLDAAALTEQDLVDLGEDHAFAPEVQEGECSA